MRRQPLPKRSWKENQVQQYNLSEAAVSRYPSVLELPRAAQQHPSLPVTGISSHGY